MQAIKSINKLIVFLLEISMLIAFGYWGFHCFHAVLTQWLFGIGTPLLAMLLWANFAAPRSGRRLHLPYRVIFSIGMFWLSDLLLYQTGLTTNAIVLMVVALVAEDLVLVLEKE